VWSSAFKTFKFVYFLEEITLIKTILLSKIGIKVYNLVFTGIYYATFDRVGTDSKVG